jgi:signal transduction histidine kinase
MTDHIANKYAEALQDVTRRYEGLVSGLSVLREVQEISRQKLAFDALCTKLISRIAGSGMAENCSFMLLNPRDQRLHLQAVASPVEEQAFFLGPDLWPGRKLLQGEGVAGRVLATGEPVCVHDVTEHSDFVHLQDSPVRFKSLLCLPLTFQDIRFGVLNLSHARKQHFSPDLMKVFELAAMRIAEALYPHVLSQSIGNRDAAAQPTRLLLTIDGSDRLLSGTDILSSWSGWSQAHWDQPDRDWYAHVHPADVQRLRDHREGVRAGDSGQLTYRFQVASGQYLEVCELSQSIPGSNTLACVLELVGADQATSLDRAQSGARLLRSQQIQALTQLASTVGAQMNTCLTSVIGNLDLALMEEDPDEARRLTREVRDIGLRCAAMVNELLNFSHQPLEETETVSVRALLEDTAKIARAIAPDSIDVRLSLPDDPGGLSGQYKQLQQVLMNLCTNAIDTLEEKYAADPTRPATLTLGAEIVKFDVNSRDRIPTPEPGTYVRIFVSDNGMGMTGDARARLFEPLFTTKRHGRGSGLGMPAVYQITRSHGGYIDVRTEEGRGTTVDLFFHTRALEAAKDPSEDRSTAPVRTVLVAEDDKAVRNLAVKILQRIGYRTLSAGDGEEALEVFRSNAEKCSAVMVDLNMPILTGAELIAAIRDIKGDIPVIVTSGKHPDELSGPEAEINPTAFLPKPFRIAHMKQVLDACFEREESA